MRQVIRLSTEFFQTLIQERPKKECTLTVEYTCKQGLHKENWLLAAYVES